MNAELRRLRGRGEISSEFGPLPSALRPWQPVQRCMKMCSPAALPNQQTMGTGFFSGTLRGFRSRAAARARRFARHSRSTPLICSSVSALPHAGIEVPGTPSWMEVRKRSFRLGGHELGLGQVARRRIQIDGADAACRRPFRRGSARTAS